MVEYAFSGKMLNLLWKQNKNSGFTFIEALITLSTKFSCLKIKFLVLKTNLKMFPKIQAKDK